MDVWLMDCQSEILHNLLACFFVFVFVFLHTPPPPTCTMFKDLSRVLHAHLWSLHHLHIFFFFCFFFSSWAGVPFSVCVFLFGFFFFFNFTFLELAVLPFFPNFHPHSLSTHLFWDKRKKELSFFFFFLLLSSSCEIELAKEKKMWNVIDLQRAEFHRVF